MLVFQVRTKEYKRIKTVAVISLNDSFVTCSFDFLKKQLTCVLEAVTFIFQNIEEGKP